MVTAADILKDIEHLEEHMEGIKMQMNRSIELAKAYGASSKTLTIMIEARDSVLADLLEERDRRHRQYQGLIAGN